MTPASVQVVHVVVPAHDEEDRLDACLTSVALAVQELAVVAPHLAVRTTVVLDGCTDSTPAIAARHGVDVVLTSARSVGAARRVGVDRVATTAYDVAPERVWVATTDADSTVPARWLRDQVDLADAGHSLVIGSVRPDSAELSARALRLWESRHDPAAPHVHGANLGFRLAAYLAVGGFRPVPQHEDVLLVRAMQRAGVAWTVGSWVVTSAREDGRTPGGFAGYVRALNRE